MSEETTGISQRARNLVFSLIRTYVPYVVVAIVGWVTEHFGPILDEGAKVELTVIVYGLAFGFYYLAARLIETYITPKFSFLLGDLRRGFSEPVYPDATETVVVPPRLPASGDDA